MTAIPLKASINDTDVQTFIAAGWVSVAEIREITEEQLCACVELRCERQESGENLYLINEAVEKVVMKMQMLDVKDLVWSLHRDYLSALRHASFAELVEERQHIASQHVLRRLKLTYLQNRMKVIIQ